MKKFILSLLTLVSIAAMAQSDKSKRPSPPAKVSESLSSDLSLTIDYSQPSLKGRKIGTEIAPYGEVWRTGANEATTFEVTNDVFVNGQTLRAGKYSLYSIPGEKEWVIIFNKTWNQWGTKYEEAEDALRIKVIPSSVDASTEKMTFMISKEGKVSLLWGTVSVEFNVREARGKM
ncbi:MAG: DUF2911 domain-containing protein [Chitinophagaceae bacterium]|nr:DUF2911 domain-containing protein [Chitinophagaceae bacterium]MBL0055343.1 DUF2911 domain-containing protein [Chitinophagaceae bacterium]